MCRVRVRLRVKGCLSAFAARGYRISAAKFICNPRVTNRGSPNTRPTELLVPGATTTTSTAGPPHPPISRVGLTAFVSRAACLRDTDTFGLELAEASLGWIFFHNKNKSLWYTRVLYWYSYLVRSKLLKHGPAMPLKAHVAAPGSTNSQRLTARPAQEGFVSMCACTEPVRTGIGAVCVDYGRPKWPITMLNRTHKHVQSK